MMMMMRMDTAIHWINQYPVDKYYQNLLSYPVDSSNLQILVHHYRDNPLFITQLLQNPSTIMDKSVDTFEQKKRFLSASLRKFK